MRIWKSPVEDKASDSACFEFSSLSRDTADVCDLADANETAEKIIASARAEAEQIRQEAFESGRKEAELQVRIEAETRQQVTAPLLAKISQSIEQLQTAAMEHAERSVLPIAVAVARKTIARELQQNPQPSADLIQESLQLLAGVDGFQIMVSPESRESVCAALKPWMGERSESPKMEVVSDASLAPGDLVLRSRYGEIDQRSETRLARILSELETA